jgi:mannonate dehydratase
MPNALHDHIKAGDEKRDQCIEKAIGMLPKMERLGIKSICFNWMAHIGWLRTRSDYPERGGAKVTAFQMADFTPTDAEITHEQLWENYRYFLDAILPHAEKHGIKLALHPDDPPLAKLGDVSRIMISFENIKKAITMIPSPMLGVTMCQSCYKIMGEDVEKAARAFGDKIFFVHFRNTEGCPVKFRETFHDNGTIDMARMIRVYEEICPNVPVRVDHVPTLNGENPLAAGYGDLGKLFAIGYLKGLLQMANTK